MALSVFDQGDDIGTGGEYTYTHEKYDELSKWDTALAGIAHDETTIRQNTTGAAMYTCDDQPSAVTLDAVAGRPAAETIVAPEKLHLTLYETTNGTRIYAQFDAEFAVEGEHMRNRESQGVSIVPEVASPAYWGQGGRMLMQNTESIIVVSDYLTEDGEVHRYGARLCRPDVE